MVVSFAVYFLGHRAQQHVDLWEDPRSAIIDRSIYEDAYIFARALNHMAT
jgi:deoxyadenosine/deoxycytidine kinase